MTAASPALPRPSREQLEQRLADCPRLPSLGGIKSALRDLLHADQSYITQVADIVRRDPSLTARLLRLVNSVYYGLESPVDTIEEAVLYLGARQIRQLALITPVIEDFHRLGGRVKISWRAFWQHCLGVAILTREVVSCARPVSEEVEYVAGLIHDVGKIAIAAAFPQHFELIHASSDLGARTLAEVEREILGATHTEIGGIYLRNHNLPEVFLEAALYHHEPDLASYHAPVVAGVQIANLMVRQAQLGNSGDPTPVSEADWLEAHGWHILFPRQSADEKALVIAQLRRTLDRLPLQLEGLV